jgi:hypothetical protein
MELWEIFLNCPVAMEEPVEFDAEGVASDTAIPPWIVAKTCTTSKDCGV